MLHHCRVPGCTRTAASSFAAYCAPHRAALRRHGAPDQKAITKARLSPYLAIVRKRIAKNADNIAWVSLDDRWRALVQHAEQIVADFALGKAGSRFERVAAQEVVKLSSEVEARSVVEVTAALVLLQEFEPRVFRSDNAFWLQLARRVRSLTDLHFGESWDNRRQRVRRHYRDMTPRAAIVMGRWLAAALGIGGKHIARVEVEERDKTARERADLHDALRKLE